MFEKKEYVVTSIDGDYAHLLEQNNDAAEDKLVARALLPENIREGSRLEYEMMMYRLTE
ncbi:MAG: chorismate--pyruvate lyase [Lachnospiraceae bacterium]|nr:chorismate--pyruvate lyase [Lachnospiraceae bacterium]